MGIVSLRCKERLLLGQCVGTRQRDFGGSVLGALLQVADDGAATLIGVVVDEGERAVVETVVASVLAVSNPLEKLLIAAVVVDRKGEPAHVPWLGQLDDAHRAVAVRLHFVGVAAEVALAVRIRGNGTGKSNNDYCEVRRAIPEWTVVLAQNPTNPWCDTSSGWVTRVTALGSYTVPKVDVQVAGTMRSDQGAPLAANWTAPNSATVGLNRPFAGVGGQTVTVNLIEPGTLYGDRVTQIDMRFAKVLRFGRTRTTVGLDLYNITNSNAILTYNQTFVATTDTWLRPNSVLQARFAKFSAQIDF